MQSILKKWGNSAAVRIPSAIMDEGKLNLDQELDISIKDGVIILEPIKQKDASLASLIDGITDENMHGSTDFGASEGQEIDL